MSLISVTESLLFILKFTSIVALISLSRLIESLFVATLPFKSKTVNIKSYRYTITKLPSLLITAKGLFSSTWFGFVSSGIEANTYAITPDIFQALVS
jgi:hypothetical protein